jgi:hypothetical protein
VEEVEDGNEVEAEVIEKRDGDEDCDTTDDSVDVDVVVGERTGVMFGSTVSSAHSKSIE